MKTLFWIKRFSIAFVSATLIIGASNLLQGNNLEQAVADGTLWGLITAGVYSTAVFYRIRHCATCKDIPPAG